MRKIFYNANIISMHDNLPRLAKIFLICNRIESGM